MNTILELALSNLTSNISSLTYALNHIALALCWGLSLLSLCLVYLARNLRL